MWKKSLYFISVLSFLGHPLAHTQETKFLIPKKAEDTSKNNRSTYDSLTEERGTFKILKDHQVFEEPATEKIPQLPETGKGPVINFNNVSITEVLKYVSRLTGKNFIYDPFELQFNITMISDSSSSVEEVLAMVLQSLRAHGYLVVEEGGSYVIHTNPAVKGTGALEDPELGIEGPQIATRIFMLQNIDASRIAAIIKTMSSENAIVEAIGDANIIVSDISENIKRVATIIAQLDSQTSGLEIGQYVAVNTSPATLISLAERVIAPIAGQKTLVLVSHASSNSVFIVSTPFLIQRTLSVMQTVDLNMAKSGILSKEDYAFNAQATEEARKERARRNYEEQQHSRDTKDTEVDILTDEEIRSRLLQQGINTDYVNSLNLESAKQVLRKSLTQHYSDGELPTGTVESTQFLIHRLQYRKSSDVAKALQAIANSLSGGASAGTSAFTTAAPDVAHTDLLICLNSLQPVDDNNTIVFTGTRHTLRKVKQLLSQIDLPVRQVFIEALVLDTSLTNSLQFGVEWGGKMQRTNLGAAINFRRTDSTFGQSLDAIQQATPVQIAPPSAPAGFSVGNLGRKIKFLGKGFRSTGALIQALSADDETHIMLNPKIVTEHNVAAEIFAGENTPIKGQSIANSGVGGITSNLVTTNYEFQETGVSLKVTPLISSHETVTLIIEQKISFSSTEQVQAQASSNAPPATVRETRTVTRVHMPSDHFLIMSGLIREDTRLQGERIPCLGGLPLIGSLFGTKKKSFGKRNMMIFIRPVIIDTEEDIDEITRHQEEALKSKSSTQHGLNKQMDDAKIFLNLPASFP